MNSGTFENRLDCLTKWRFPVITLDQAITGLTGGALPPGPVVITIDDGWYSTYHTMLPALKDRGIPATLYCDTNNLLHPQAVPHVMARYIRQLVESGYSGSPILLNPVQSAIYDAALMNHGDTLERMVNVRKFAESVSFDFDRYLAENVFAYMTPEQLRELYLAGLDVQLHTHNHTMREMDPEGVAKEIAENRCHLSHILGADQTSFRHFCYPSGDFSSGLTGLLYENGIRSSTTVEQSIAYSDCEMQLLPRILDGEQLTCLEFEAELCGVMDLLRMFKNWGNK